MLLLNKMSDSASLFDCAGDIGLNQTGHCGRLTLMLRPRYQFSNHCLNDANVSIEGSKKSTCQRNPEVGCKSDQKHTHDSTGAANEQDGFSADAIGKAAPEHASARLCQGKGADEQTGIEGGIAVVSDVESLNQGPSIWKGFESAQRCAGGFK